MPSPSSTETEAKSFWTTLPGILAAVGGLITAVAALLTALFTSGMIGGEKATPPPVDTQLIVEERFDDLDSGWASRTSADDQVGYRDGEYRIEVFRPGITVWSSFDPGERMSDYVIEADVRQVEGSVDSSFGLLVRSQSAQDGFYLFEIGADGTYAVELMVAGEWETLVDWTSSELVREGVGASNTLRVACQGSDLSFYVNGSLLVDLSNDAFRAGHIGLAAGTFEEGPVAVHFDNVVVRSLAGP